MSDIDRAAEVLFRWNVRHGPYFVIGGGHVFDTDDPYKPIAQVLDAAGLLVTPAHDAAVAAKAWDEGHTAGVRNASTEFDGPVQGNPYTGHEGVINHVQ